ncbi:MAG: hypothetical protein N2749_01245 [Clostridia bacterium]|nr:hypothetical protein [Clostridia bacterium]
MNTIIITEDILKNEIPEEISPRNLDSATNLLVNVRHNGVEGMIVLNPSPDVWKTWYSFYDSKNKYITKYDFKSKTYEELIEEYEKIFERNAKAKEKRIECAKNVFGDLYKVSDLHVIESDKIKPIYQLRYSKTSNMWTIYKIEFFIVTKVDNKYNLMEQRSIEQTILPFKYDVDTLLNGLPITDSIKLVLKDLEQLSELKKYIIEI